MTYDCVAQQRLVAAWSVFAFSSRRGPVRNLIGAPFARPWCVSATVTDEEHLMSSRRVLERLNLLEGLGQVKRLVSLFIAVVQVFHCFICVRCRDLRPEFEI